MTIDSTEVRGGLSKIVNLILSYHTLLKAYFLSRVFQTCSESQGLITWINFSLVSRANISKPKSRLKFSYRDFFVCPNWYLGLTNRAQIYAQLAILHLIRSWNYRTRRLYLEDARYKFSKTQSFRNKLSLSRTLIHSFFVLY